VSRGTVLVVDDVQINVIVLETLLTTHDFTVQTAYSEQEALSSIATLAPDLILLDISMPDMNGFEVCRRLKSLPTLCKIPIIFISAEDSIEGKKRAFSEGGVDYILKPYHHDEVIARAKTHIELYHYQNSLQSKVEEQLQKQRKQEQILIQQSKMASMGEMINSIAHQWRQPLNVLSLMLADLKDTYEYGELDASYLNRYEEDMLRQIFYMSHTIDDFRNFIKPTRIAHNFDIRTLIDDVVKLAKAQLKEKEITVTIHDEISTNALLYGYENELKQVILNLIHNARDAIDVANNKRPKAIIISSVEKNERIEVSIKDSGNGIDPSLRETIFDQYITTKGDKGTGIGLYMAKTIIEENMDGTLWVRDTQDGAEFVMSLPCKGDR
jgi:signal transduction histidine kinase